MPMRMFTAFRGECERCRLSFPLPWIGDMAYGCFVFSRIDGKSFRSIEAGGHPIWAFVSSLVPAADVAEVVARLADHEDANAFTALPVCPRCAGTGIRVDDSLRFSDITVPSATFTAFESLIPAERKRAVETAFRAMQANGAVSNSSKNRFCRG